MTSPKPNGRAVTVQDKKVVLQHIEESWRMPRDMRLGQLIYNALCEYSVDHKLLTNDHTMADFLFNVEDFTLAEILRGWAGVHYGEESSQTV